MDEWSRKTLWRQGSIIEGDSIKNLGLSCNLSGSIIVLASHDCDITQQPTVEPNIEIIIGKYIDKLDGAFTNTKNPRRLQVELLTADGVKVVEFLATAKHSIPKKNFQCLEPSQNLYLTSSSLAIFKRWLGIRYTRSAFPDAFDTRLKYNDLDKKIAKTLKKRSAEIIAIFFDVDEGVESHREASDDTYTLDIVILYSTDIEAFTAQTVAEDAKCEIEKAFRDKLYNSSKGTWSDIELRYCDVISEDALSYKQSTILKQWRLEHISFAENEPLLITE